MSLIFGTVNRKNRTQSIYSDGIIIQENDIITQTKNKLVSFTTFNHYTVSAGFCGLLYVNEHFRLNLQDAFNKTFTTPEPNLLDLDMMLSQMFNNLAEQYYQEYNIQPKAVDRTSHIGGILIINGIFYLIERYEGELFHSLKLEGIDSYAHGQGEIPARCLLDNNVKPQKILQTIAKYNNSISPNLSAIENICYEPIQ